MKNLFAACSLFTVLFVAGSCVSAQPANSTKQTEWNPQRTWVFMVGLLEWKDKKEFASFPQKNRRDAVLLDVLRTRGVPENQILYLKDSAATTAKIQSSFESFLSRPQPGDWIFVYYCGHGYKSEDNSETFLASFDATDKIGWRVNDIPETIDKIFKGSHALVMLDNCFSGAMAETLKNRRSPVSYAVLASSHFNSFSTGNWTFTESLIYAFRGEPFVDDDANGRVTLGELVENAAEDMLFAEEQIAQFALTGKFNNQTIIAANTKKSVPRLGERIEAFDQGDWYRAIITDVQHNEFKVHFFGYEYDEDAFRNAKQIRSFSPKQFKIGSGVEVESDKKWYPAKVLEVKEGAHLIAYDEFGEEWNEWVSSDRVRRRK